MRKPIHDSVCKSEPKWAKVSPQKCCAIFESWSSSRLLLVPTLGRPRVKHSLWKLVFLFLAPMSGARACHIYVYLSSCSRQSQHVSSWWSVFIRKPTLCWWDASKIVIKTGRHWWCNWRCWCWRRWWCLRLCPDVPPPLQSHFCHADNFGQEPLSHGGEADTHRETSL